MKRTFFMLFVIICLFYFSVTIFFSGCSGGGNENNVEITSSNDTGIVSVLLRDGPSNEYEHIWLWISEVSLLTTDNEEPVMIFKSNDPLGYKVDLLDLKDQDFLLSTKKIPTGYYSKIRLKVADIQPEGGTGECLDFEIKLPSGKIDINSKEKFEVISGEAIAIRLDIDMEKSFDLHLAGESHKCIFQPLIFADIESVSLYQHCPRILSGDIYQLIYDPNDQNILGFKLDLKNARGFLDVSLTDETIIFGENGLIAEPEDLEEGETIYIRGRLNMDGGINASVIVIGGVEIFKGTVKDSTQEDFTLNLSNNTGELNVCLSDETIILTGCDETFDEEIIPEGMIARVYGKFDSSTGPSIFQAIAVLISPPSPKGILTDIEPTTGGYNLTIENKEGEFTVFLPDEAKIKLKGDGVIDIDRLTTWVACSERPVEVIFDYETKGLLKATTLLILPDKIYTKVIEKDNLQYILYTPEGDIKVEETATIFKMECGHQSLIEFYEIHEEDDVLTYGIEACFDDANNFDFYAFVVVINPAVEADCAFLPKVINENNITIYLPDGKYEQDLIIYGNNFTLNGVTKDPTLSQCSTILACNVEIRGNNTTFENIKFVRYPRDYGNNTQFNNCCFGDE